MRSTEHMDKSEETFSGSGTSERALLEIKPAEPDQYDELLDMIKREAENYLESSLSALGMEMKEFARLFRTVGEVNVVYIENRLAGFFWVEKRENTLHIHGLALEKAFQGRGLGTRILESIETECGKDVDTIELGVHKSNRRAISLYMKSGYVVVRELADIGFYIMRKPLHT